MPEVQVFIDAVETAGGVLTITEKSAINSYVADAKNNANAWWTDRLADWPFVGSSMAAHQINLRNPGTFDLTFVNTVAGDHTTNGWLPNAVNSYARTGITPLTHITLNNTWMEMYSRTAADGSDDFVSHSGVGTSVLRLSSRNSNTTFFDSYNQTDGAGRVSIASADGSGGFAGSRTANNHSILTRNGAEIDRSTGGGGTLPNFEFYLGASNLAGVASFFSNKEFAGAAVGLSLTVAQVLAQYKARQTMNTVLNRQV